MVERFDNYGLYVSVDNNIATFFLAVTSAAAPHQLPNDGVSPVAQPGSRATVPWVRSPAIVRHSPGPPGGPQSGRAPRLLQGPQQRGGETGSRPGTALRHLRPVRHHQTTAHQQVPTQIPIAFYTGSK